jgi:hypothetical protein
MQEGRMAHVAAGAQETIGRSVVPQAAAIAKAKSAVKCLKGACEKLEISEVV